MGRCAIGFVPGFPELAIKILGTGEAEKLLKALALMKLFSLAKL